MYELYFLDYKNSYFVNYQCFVVKQIKYSVFTMLSIGNIPWIKLEHLAVINRFWKRSFLFRFSIVFKKDRLVFGKNDCLVSEKRIVFENDPLVLNFNKTNNDRFWKR